MTTPPTTPTPARASAESAIPKEAHILACISARRIKAEHQSGREMTAPKMVLYSADAERMADYLLAMDAPKPETVAEAGGSWEADEPMTERQMIAWTKSAIRKWNADPKCKADHLGVDIIDMSECLCDALEIALNVFSPAPASPTGDDNANAKGTNDAH